MSKSIENQLLCNTTLKKVIAELFSEEPYYSKYKSLEELVLENIDDPRQDEKQYKKFLSIFQKCLNSLLTPYRREDFFPSSNISADILFSLIKAKAGDGDGLIQQFIEELHLSGLTESAIVVFPIYSYAVLDAGIIGFLRKQNLHFETKDMVLFPQHNSVERSISALEYAKEQFGMGRYSYDIGLIKHFLRSRPLDWFEKNQLLICKINFSSADYYENVYFLSKYLERSVCKIYFAHVLIRKECQLSSSKELSTGMVNNWETRDINHYLVFTKVGEKLSPACIPMRNELSDTIELSNLNIKMPISTNPSVRKKIDQFGLIIDKVFQECVPSSNKKTYQQEFYERIRMSFLLFAKSYQSKGYSDSVLYLAAAFEVLYAEGNKNDVVYTVGKTLACMAFRPNANDIMNNFSQLYNARSEAAHTGKSASSCDLIKCREIYLDSIFQVNQLLYKNSLDLSSRTPLSDYVRALLIKRIGFKLKV